MPWFCWLAYVVIGLVVAWAALWLLINKGGAPEPRSAEDFIAVGALFFVLALVWPAVCVGPAFYVLGRLLRRIT